MGLVGDDEVEGRDRRVGLGLGDAGRRGVRREDDPASRSPQERRDGIGVRRDRHAELVGADPPLVGLHGVGIGADGEIDEREGRRLAPLATELLEEQQGGDEDEDALVGPRLGDPER